MANYSIFNHTQTCISGSLLLVHTANHSPLLWTCSICFSHNKLSESLSIPTSVLLNKLLEIFFSLHPTLASYYWLFKATCHLNCKSSPGKGLTLCCVLVTFSINHTVIFNTLNFSIHIRICDYLPSLAWKGRTVFFNCGSALKIFFSPGMFNSSGKIRVKPTALREIRGWYINNCCF